MAECLLLTPALAEDLVRRQVALVVAATTPDSLRCDGMRRAYITLPANRHRSADKFADWGLRRRRRAHEVALADLDAAQPDDVVGGGRVKPEVWQTVTEQ